MSIFGSRKELAEPIPNDPNELLVDEIHLSYPYGAEAFGLRSMIRIVVRVVLEMKKRGMLSDADTK